MAVLRKCILCQQMRADWLTLHNKENDLRSG